MLTRGVRMTKIGRTTIASIAVAVALIAAPALAQNARSSIQGRVTDSAGGVLQGASVTIQPGGEHTATGNEGQFTITGLEPGAYMLTVSFVGFDVFQKGVEVTAGQSARLDPVLQVASQSAS